MLAAFAAVILAAAPAAKQARASADDCAVILAVARSQMAWTARTPPPYAFFPEIEGEGGAITYVESCPWKAMGVAAPRIGDGQSPNGFFVTRPAYDPSRTKATAELTRSIVGMENQGEPMRGFMETRACDLEKRGGSWRVVGCRLAAIS
jgi:hypothetical protein